MIPNLSLAKSRPEFQQASPRSPQRHRLGAFEQTPPNGKNDVTDKKIHKRRNPSNANTSPPVFLRALRAFAVKLFFS